MAGKAKFDQEAAFRSIVRPEQKASQVTPAPATTAVQNAKSRVQRAYYLDRDMDKALRRKAMEEEKTLTEAINDALRKGLAEYL